MPVNSIPMSRGRVVKDMSHPPKLAPTVNVTSEKSCPPGAAESPRIAYVVAHIIKPIK